MEISFLDLKEKEVVNVYTGAKLGHVIDVVFSVKTGEVLGLVVPGDRKLFRKSDDVFIPLSNLKRIGEDVILVGLMQTSAAGSRLKTKREDEYANFYGQNFDANVKANKAYTFSKPEEQTSYVRMRPLSNKKYK